MKEKKKLLFTANTLGIGGIEKALVNLLDYIDYDKYDVDLILEKKEGEFLERINKNVNVKELKVSSNKIVFIRKIVNLTRKLLFKIKNKNKYDFSCCYATYSLSANKLARIASTNSSIYIHSNYKDLYSKKDFLNFFNNRNINEFKNILFVSNEARDGFLEIYKELENKTKVFNNFIDINEIINNSKEKIDLTKPKDKTLFVFIGRLDDSSKKLTRAINLVKEINDTIFWIIGDGKDRKMYEELVNKNKLNDRVIFLGMKKNPYPYLKEADYFLLTSEYEGFPVTYLESVVLNKRIITTINTSDESINMEKDYANIISKDEKEMVKEVRKIIKENKTPKKIDLEKIQKERIKELEKVFNGDDIND